MAEPRIIQALDEKAESMPVAYVEAEPVAALLERLLTQNRLAIGYGPDDAWEQASALLTALRK